MMDQKMRWPRITLVTPSFNSAATIERTLLSVERQSYPNLQYICVDGASKDETVSILQRYRHIVSRIISEPDNNATEAINKGFRLADGEIYCYINADDELADAALVTAATYFNNNPDVDVIAGSCRRVFEDKSETITEVHEAFLEELALRNLIEQPSTFWRSSLHRKAGEFDESFFYAFDWEMWNRFKSAGARFKAVEDVLSIYHFSADNLTSRAGKKVIDEMFRITRQYGPNLGLIAYAYRTIFRLLDMKGYYDGDIYSLSLHKRFYFLAIHGLLGLIFKRSHLQAYNWNWASKQIRGGVWYK